MQHPIVDVALGAMDLAVFCAGLSCQGLNEIVDVLNGLSTRGITGCRLSLRRHVLDNDPRGVGKVLSALRDRVANSLPAGARSSVGDIVDFPVSADIIQS